MSRDRVTPTLNKPTMAAFNGPLHSYPSVPSGVSPPVNPYERKPFNMGSWELFPLSLAARQTPKDTSLLLALPVELRLHILQYTLPSTIAGDANPSKAGEAVLWRRGSTAILATNKQLHEEGSRLLYGGALFNLDVSYGRITFLFTRYLDSGLMPKQTPSFEDRIAHQYWPLIRIVRIQVTLEDDYVANIKFNWGGAGYIAGMKAQLQRLVDILKSANDLRLSLNLKSSRSRSVAGEAEERDVLVPLLKLANVRSCACGDRIPEDFAERMVRRGS